MNVANLRTNILAFVEDKQINLKLYFLFVLIFFVSPNLRLHCNLFYGLIIPVYLLSLNKTKIRFFLGSRMWLVTMALLVYLVLTILWEKNTGDKSATYYIRKVVYLFVFFSLTMELSLTSPRFIEKLFFFMAWMGTATAVASMLYFYHTGPFPAARLEYIADQLHNAVFGAIIYGMIVLIIYFDIMKKIPDRKRRWLYGMMAAIIVGSVVLTQSRGPLGILLITFIVGGLLTRDFKLLIVLTCVIILGATLFIKNDSIRKAVTQRGLSYRIELAEKTVNMIKGDVFFGKGITTDQQIRANDGFLLYHPHNVYLGMVLYGGLAGLFIFLLLLAMAFRESLRHYLLTGDIILLALLLFGAGNIFIDQDKVITHPGPFWFFFWLPLALTAGIAAQKPKDPD